MFLNLKVRLSDAILSGGMEQLYFHPVITQSLPYGHISVPELCMERSCFSLLCWMALDKKSAALCGGPL